MVGMRAVIQRVSRAQVSSFDDETIDEATDARFRAGETGDGSESTRTPFAVEGFEGEGLAVLLGVTHNDTEAEAKLLADKIYGLRVLAGERSCEQAEAPLLVVSQFTLYGDSRKGRRPSWSAAAPEPHSRPLYERFIELLRASGAEVHTGVFGARMELDLVNDGPVTLILDSAELSGPRRVSP